MDDLFGAEPDRGERANTFPWLLLLLLPPPFLTDGKRKLNQEK